MEYRIRERRIPLWVRKEGNMSIKNTIAWILFAGFIVTLAVAFQYNVISLFVIACGLGFASLVLASTNIMP